MGRQIFIYVTNICQRVIRRVFTIIELLVVIAVITVLASLLLPSLGKAKMRTQEIACLNNLKNIGIASFSYTDSYDEWLLPAYERSVWWPFTLLELGFLSGQAVFQCPAENVSALAQFSDINKQSYGHNYYTLGTSSSSLSAPMQKLALISKFNNNSNLVCFGDATPLSYLSSGRSGSPLLDGGNRFVFPHDGADHYYPVFIRHQRNAAFVFLDGHAGALDYDSIKLKAHWYPGKYTYGGL
jgi:prepilin-type processing-associated H-X9-DG protein